MPANKPAQDTQTKPEAHMTPLKRSFAARYGFVPDIEELERQIRDGEAKPVKNAQEELSGNSLSLWWVKINASKKVVVMYNDSRGNIVLLPPQARFERIEAGETTPSMAERGKNAEERAFALYGITTAFRNSALKQIQNGEADFIREEKMGLREVWRVTVEGKKIPVVYNKEDKDLVTVLHGEQAGNLYLLAPEKSIFDAFGIMPNLQDMARKIQQGEAERIHMPCNGPHHSMWWVSEQGNRIPVIYADNEKIVIGTQDARRVKGHEKYNPPPRR